MPQRLKQNRRNAIFKSKQKFFSPNKSHSRVWNKACVLNVCVGKTSSTQLEINKTTVTKHEHAKLAVPLASRQESTKRSRGFVLEERALKQNQSQ